MSRSGKDSIVKIVAQRVAALALDRLALARGERGEESVEIAIALVEEMELLAGAARKTRRPSASPRPASRR